MHYCLTLNISNALDNNINGLTQGKIDARDFSHILDIFLYNQSTGIIHTIHKVSPKC